MDRALELGLNFFDTANVYGGVRGEGITEQIVGPRTLQQLDDCQRALAIALDAATQAEIDAIWPGPDGQAPEAYAW